MISHDLHRRELIAASEVCTVERCDDCCVVHVHFGAATVRFTSEAFAAPPALAATGRSHVH